MTNYKQFFPIFADRHYHYLDSAATSLKPKTVIDSVNGFYEGYTAPVHRSQYRDASTATMYYEQAREAVAGFIGAKSHHSIIFTKNTNEGMNLIVNDLKEQLTDRDVIVLSKAEHHANIVPWLEAQRKINFKIRYLDIDVDYRLMWEQIEDWNLREKDAIRVVSLQHASNVTGTINPIKEIISFIKEELPGNTIAFIVDGAQAIPHIPVNVTDIGCDYYVFSGHKMLAPSGVGVLYMQENIRKLAQPLLFGSHMIEEVTEGGFKLTGDESDFEAGTPNIEGVIGLGEAVRFLHMNMKIIQRQEEELTIYGLEQLTKINKIAIYGSLDPEKRLGIFSFNLANIHPHDVSHLLGERNIYVRAGDHCCQPLMHRLDIPACVRASLYLYNDKEDIDALVEGIKNVQKVFNKK